MTEGEGAPSRSGLRPLALAVPLVALACSACALFATRAWALELVASFRWQEAVVCTVLSVVLLLLRRDRAALVTFASALHLAWPVLAVVVPQRTAMRADDRTTFTVANANVLFSNPEYEAFRAWVRAEHPDLLAVDEVMPEWRRALDDLREFYPHHLVCPDPIGGPTPFGFGIALYSRFPLKNARERMVVEGALPLLEADVVVGTRRVHVVAMHPPAPHGTWLWEIRNRYLEGAPALIARDTPVVVLADMNTSSGSPVFARFLAATGLVDSRCGFGRLATWRTDTALRGLWVDLDHVLVSPEVSVLARGVSTIPGSDHLAATATLALGP